jgi:excinuclease ABC subunit C
VFKAHDRSVLYVGKAANLRTRVRSYFQSSSSDSRYFIDRLDHELGDIETFVTASEKEATLLENGLIKEHQPRYNVKLRDDKDYLSLRLSLEADWPRLEVVRRPRKDGARYFGPYHSATAARSTLRVVNRHFQLRTCTDADMRARTRPCLQHQIKRCPAPCVGLADQPLYAEQARNVALFLDGRHDQLLDHLQQRMTEAAETTHYELAATYRDQIRAVESSRQGQRVSLVSDIDQDVFGFFRQTDKAEFAVLLARAGRVVGVRTFEARDIRVPDDELIASFVTEYYARGTFVPDEVLLPVALEAMQGVADVLSDQNTRKVELLSPQRGQKAQLLRMAMENAVHAFREKARAREDLQARLLRAQQTLQLPTLPRRVECIDISHTSGRDTVAAIVTMQDGELDRSGYRTFHIRDVDGGDDYGAMNEALTRRFKRAARGEAQWQPPDLLVVDGGKGQLGIARQVLEELGLRDVPVVGIAKEKQTALGSKVVDRVYVPGRKNAVELRDAEGALIFIAVLRDEAHRSSNEIRQRLGKRKNLRSGLEDIKGVGPKTRGMLLKTLGSLSAIKSASVDQLIEAGATKRQATAIKDAYKADPSEASSAEQDAIENAFADSEPSS